MNKRFSKLITLVRLWLQVPGTSRTALLPLAVLRAVAVTAKRLGVVLVFFGENKLTDGIQQ